MIFLSEVKVGSLIELLMDDFLVLPEGTKVRHVPVGNVYLTEITLPSGVVISVTHDVQATGQAHQIVVWQQDPETFLQPPVHVAGWLEAAKVVEELAAKYSS